MRHRGNETWLPGEGRPELDLEGEVGFTQVEEAGTAGTKARRLEKAGRGCAG